MRKFWLLCLLRLLLCLLSLLLEAEPLNLLGPPEGVEPAPPESLLLDDWEGEEVETESWRLSFLPFLVEGEDCRGGFKEDLDITGEDIAGECLSEAKDLLEGEAGLEPATFRASWEGEDVKTLGGSLLVDEEGEGEGMGERVTREGEGGREEDSTRKTLERRRFGGFQQENKPRAGSRRQ